jgi:L-lactate dehydrogenase complex protein LldE
MRIGLFIPCYIDQFYPQVGIATLKIFERLRYSVTYPLNQTCCGQPQANAGFSQYGLGAGKLFLENFQQFDYVVSPSSSCVLHIKEHSDATIKAAFHHKIYELCEFLTDILRVEHLGASFPHKVGLHISCHGLRGLRLANASELHEPFLINPKNFLKK